MSEFLQTGLAMTFILLGLVVNTLAVIGMIRLKEFRLRLHAASMVSVMGVLPLLLASFGIGDAPIIARSGLIIGFLLLTTSASLHSLAYADASRQHKVTAMSKSPNMD